MRPCLDRCRSAALMFALGGTALAACSDRPARVALKPLGGACAQPAQANAVNITAYAASGEQSRSVALDQTVAISDFPADTEQIGVEVIVGGGEIGAAGKSAPLAFAALADGATIPVLMAPLDGFCPIATLNEPRAQPLIARAGDGALVIGGVGADAGGTGVNGPLSTAEYFDPATATFSPVEVPQVLVNPQGFTGAALATLPDGRVALIGGVNDALVVFDPRTRAFGPAGVVEHRALHAALAIGANDVLVAGGCVDLSTPCAPRTRAVIYHLDDLNQPVPGPQLAADDEVRIGAQLFDLGVQLDGTQRYLLAGGTGGAGAADRFAFADANHYDQLTTTLKGGAVQVAALDGGAVLTAFGDDATIDGTAAVYAPDAAASQLIARAPDRTHVRLIELEDGRIAGFGGEILDGQMKLSVLTSVVIYDPLRDAWTEDEGAPALNAPSVVRLSDGSVLVLGGAPPDLSGKPGLSDPSQPSNQAWLFRPSLVGPASGAVTVVPGDDSSDGELTVPDPSTVSRTLGEPRTLELHVAQGVPLARALVGGPRMASGSLRAIVHVVTGGAALIAQQTAPGQLIVAELAPGQPARLVRYAAGGTQTLCSGSPVPAFDPAIAAVLRLAISDTGVQLSIGDSSVLACNVVAADRGAWGIAAFGDGAQILVDSVAVAR